MARRREAVAQAVAKSAEADDVDNRRSTPRVALGHLAKQQAAKLAALRKKRKWDAVFMGGAAMPTSSTARAEYREFLKRSPQLPLA